MELKTLVRNQFGGYSNSNGVIDITLLLSFIAIIIFYISYKYMRWRDREILIAQNLTGAYSPDSCPDYWVEEEGEGSNICRNEFDVGSNNSNNSNNTINFSQNKYNNVSSGMINKCKWSNNNDIPWTGLDHIC